MPALARPSALAVLLTLAAPALAQDADPEFARGRDEYLAACAACHGEAADGNGPIATMFREPVPGLRGLAAANDGAFPTLDVFMIIDGRTGVRAHGAPMPLFGARYKAEIGQQLGPFGAEQALRARVLELVYYLDSIQEP